MRGIVALSAMLLLVIILLAVAGCTTPSVPTTAQPTEFVPECHPDSDPIDRNAYFAVSLPPDRDETLYCLYLPTGLGFLEITIQDLSEDFDLYIYRSYDQFLHDPPSWVSDDFGTNVDSVFIPNPQEGYYYIHVYNVQSYGGTYTLIVESA